MWPITWVTEFSSWITLTFPLWHVVREGIALDSMLMFKIYLGLARRPEADFNISYWASVNDSQAVKISNKARGSGSPGCTTYHHIACCWRHQVLRWWWIWRCCIWGYLAAASVNLMQQASVTIPRHISMASSQQSYFIIVQLVVVASSQQSYRVFQKEWQKQNGFYGH